MKLLRLRRSFPTSGTSSVPSRDGFPPAQNQLFLSYFVSWHARFREVGTAETLISVAAGFGAGALCLSAPVWAMIPPGLQRGASMASAIAAGVAVFVAAWRTQASKRARQSATDTLASALLDTNRECMKLLDVNGRMLRVSEYGAQLMDASSPLDLAGADWLGFWKGADSATAKTAFNDALAGRYASFRALCHTTTGRPKWWDSRLTPLKNHNGKVVAVVCASTDITDQTELLTQLQAKNALMSEMEAHMPIVFYSYSANFDYFHYITAGCVKVFGLEPAVFEQAPSAWMKLVLDEDLPPLVAEMNRIVAESADGRAQYRIRKPDGSVRWLCSTGYPVRDASGEVLRIVGITEDITA